MLIVLASQSEVKLSAVRDALHDARLDASVVGVRAASGVAEQPVDEETQQGARNRALHARQLRPGADLYLAIESGLFTDGAFYDDKAVVLALTASGKQVVSFSEAVRFPGEMVRLAESRGFATTTPGAVMVEKGLVRSAADPHADLGEKIPRATLLRNATAALLRTLLQEGLLKTSGPAPCSPSPTP